MPVKLATTVNKISLVPNVINSAIIREFSEYMKQNGSSEHHQNNDLKTVISFATFLGRSTTFYEYNKGNTLRSLGRHDEAIRSFEEGIR